MKTQLRRAGGMAALLALAACADASRGGRAPAPPAPVADETLTDPSYDWRSLVRLPFGTLLKASPIGLHEVLLFRDQARGSSEGQSKDCYAADGAPPRFLGRQADSYLLCFEHDRLHRIEASVRLAADDADTVFARACARWLQGTAPPPVPGGVCEGRDGDIGWSAYLTPVTGASRTDLSIALTEVGERAVPGGPAIEP